MVVDRRDLEAADERLRRAAVLGVFTMRMALAAGLTRGVARGRLAAGTWAHVAGTAYVDATVGMRGAIDAVRQRAIAAALTWPDSVLCLRTAALLHGMPLADDGIAHVVLPGRRAASRRIVPHYFDVGGRDVRRMLSFRVTSPRRTAIDCLAHLPRPEAESLLAWVQTRGIVTPAQLAGAVQERRGTPGVVQLRRLLEASRTGALSEAERRLHQILHDADIRGWEADQPIAVGGSVIARVDVLFRAARLIVEVDGRKAHQDFERDRERLNALALAGYTVLRFTWRQLVEQPWRVAEQIEAALRRAAN